MPTGDIEIVCNNPLCANNDKSLCKNNCDINQLNPGKRDCPEFVFDTTLYDTNLSSPSYIDKMLEDINFLGIPFLSLDKDSTHFESVHTADGYYCLIQGSEKDLMKYNFWRDDNGLFEFSLKGK